MRCRVIVSHAQAAAESLTTEEFKVEEDLSEQTNTIKSLGFDIVELFKKIEDLET